LESNPDAVYFNTAVNYATNVYLGAAGLFRVGSGVGNAIYNPCADDPFGDVLQDVGRASSIALILAGPAAGILGESSSTAGAATRGVGGSLESELPGLPSSAPKPLGLASTGRTTPASLGEQLAMEEAISNPSAGSPVPMRQSMGDPRWPGGDGWIKMQQRDNQIHYNLNTRTGAVDDFKFK
jgi:hypothetical protein